MTPEHLILSDLEDLVEKNKAEFKSGKGCKILSVWIENKRSNLNKAKEYFNDTHDRIADVEAMERVYRYAD
jgi:ClpP class serine protease